MISFDVIILCDVTDCYQFLETKINKLIPYHLILQKNLKMIKGNNKFQLLHAVCDRHSKQLENEREKKSIT